MCSIYLPRRTQILTDTPIKLNYNTIRRVQGLFAVSRSCRSLIDYRRVCSLSENDVDIYADANSQAFVAGSVSKSTALVWFKMDLRIDDHPGLHLAQTYENIVPIFCFDPMLHTQLLRTPNGLEGLVGAVDALGMHLKSLGSRLVVKEGNASDILPVLAAQHFASAILAEEEVEYRWLNNVIQLKSKIPQGVELRLWKAGLFTDEPYSANFRQFQKQRGEPLEPLGPPHWLPGIHESLLAEGQVYERLQLWKDLLLAADAEITSPQIREAAKSYEESWGSPSSAVVARLAKGGEPEVQRTLREYLAADSGSSEISHDLLEAVRRSETNVTPMGSFPAIFALAATLGAVSRRRVFWEAQQALASPKKGFLDLPRRRLPKAAATTAEAGDFHWHVAREDRLRDTATGAAPRHWRWRGFLTDYFTAEPEELGGQTAEPEAPAFLLVHGFGAFGEQWRGQIRALAAAGYHVFAPTLPGYGRAEKPSLPYSQDLWVAFLRDFVVEVVRRPVVVAGNSIGGFIAASLAADHGKLVQGLVLFNSAGLLKKGYTPPEAGRKEPASKLPGFVADALSSALIFYLERTVARVLTRVYPINPAMADAWLMEEITRAAADPGAKGVFRSVFYLPKPRPLNFLVADGFGGPTLIVQGVRDPLQDARGRALQMARLCPNVRVELLEAGHCPFDERPDLANAHLLAFVRSLGPAPAAPRQLSPV